MFNPRIQFFIALLMFLVIDTFVVALVSGPSLSMLVAIVFLVVPALCSGIDLWQFVSRKLDGISAWFSCGSEGAAIARLLVAYFCASLPVAIVMLVLCSVTSGQFSRVLEAGDPIRIAFGVSIWHAFVGAVFTHKGRRGIGVAGLVGWFIDSGRKTREMSN